MQGLGILIPPKADRRILCSDCFLFAVAVQLRGSAASQLVFLLTAGILSAGGSNAFSHPGSPASADFAIAGVVERWKPESKDLLF